MKKIIGLTCCLVLMAQTLKAEETIPKIIHFQAVVTDDGGNVISDEIQESDVTFRIKDGTGEILYTETQNLPVVRGMISVFIGEGSDEGIPAEVFAPDGDRILEFQMEDHTIPQETVLIGSTPYSYYAEAIAGGIESSDINDGVIELADLSDSVIAYIEANAGESDGSVTSLDAENVTFTQALVNTRGGDVESVIVGVDTALTIHRDRMEGIEGGISDETTARTAADTALQGQIDAEEAVRAAADTALQSAVTAAQADADAAQSTANTARNEAGDAQDAADAAQADVNAVDGRLDNAESTVSDHENRITELERDDDFDSEDDIPQALKPYAYGICHYGSGSDDDTTSDLYHITASETGTSADCDGQFTYNFTESPSNTNYVVIVSPHADADCYVHDKTTSGFNISCDGTVVGYDYIVFHNPSF